MAVGYGFIHDDFDQFNIGADIAAPSMKEIAASQYLALVGLLNTQLNSAGSALDADQSAQDLSFDALQLRRLILETPSHESDVRDGAEAQSGPGRDS